MGLKSEEGRLLRGLAFDQQLRFSVALTTPIANTLFKAHQPSAQGLLALSRSATAVALISATLKDRQQIGIQVNGDGPLGELYAVSTSKGEIRATVHHPQASAEPMHELGSAIGEGRFTLIKTSASGAPYRGTVPIFTGGVAEDLAFYYMHSEQVPTACGIGEKVEEGQVTAAGGYFVQCLPHTHEETKRALESAVLSLPKLQDLLLEDHCLESLLSGLFGTQFEVLHERPVRFSCPCERPRFARSLLSLGKAELSKLQREDGEISLLCHFCATQYHFNHEELGALIYGARS
jgi:molecular chaperone Hsp33